MKYVFAQNINNTGTNGIVEVETQQLLCLCSEKSSAILQDALESTPPVAPDMEGAVSEDEINTEFRGIISHALLGCNTDNIDRETWELICSECTKYAIKLASSLPSGKGWIEI